jgi:hypothetical protein
MAKDPVCGMQVDEKKAIKVTKGREDYFFEKKGNLICSCCTYKIVNPGFKRVYIKFENDFFKKYLKSNIIICKKCYERHFTLYATFRETPFNLDNPDLYLNEYRRIKRIYKNV